jgi:hypothetical protein
VRGEDGGNVGARPVDLVDQSRDPRCHHEEVPRFDRACVSVGVRCPTSSKHGGAGTGLDVVRSEPEPKRPFEHVPRLVVLVVDMQRRDPMAADHSTMTKLSPAEPIALPRRGSTCTGRLSTGRGCRRRLRPWM